MMQSRSGADILADTLAAFAVPIVTFIPGEGILDLLDAIEERAASIALCSFRHEAGMAYAAQAIGQLSGQPGVCLAARAPGALNTCLALHTAYTDSAPMVMIVGQASTAHLEREAFLGADDYHRTFGAISKWVGLILAPERIPEMLSRAWQIALSGRRGPVVLVLPEDVATRRVEEDAASTVIAPGIPAPGPAAHELLGLRDALARAQRPLLLLGGTGWREDGLAAISGVAHALGLPMATSYRRRDLVDHDDALFIGEIGLGADPGLAAQVAAADLLIVVNARLGELNTVAAGAFEGFSLLSPQQAANCLVHIHPGSAELNSVYQAHLVIQADPNTFALAWLADLQRVDIEASGTANHFKSDWARQGRLARQSFVTSGSCPGELDLRQVCTELARQLGADGLLTSGAGAYAVWTQRYVPHHRVGTQLGPKSGAMGYGLSAAIGAGLLARAQARPRRIVALAGDGCFMMHAEELETALRLGLDLVVIVINNSCYGAIDVTQRKRFGRAIGTRLTSIDFAAFARAFGARGETVSKTARFGAALESAFDAGGVSLIELRVDQTLGKPQ